MTVTIDESKEREILEEAHQNIGDWFDVFGGNIKVGQDDKEFVYESQWTEAESTQFATLNKPEIQINKIHGAIRKITGQQRSIDPQIKVMAKDFVSSDDEQALIANQKKINLLQNLIRTISYDSQAKLAYARAFENALTSGFGALMIKTDYVDERSFDQRPFIDSVPFEMAFFDVKAEKPTKSDSKYCGYYKSINKTDFEREYPDVPPTAPSYPSFENQGDFLWYDKDQITLVYYYKREYKKRTLYKLTDNTTMFKDEYEQRQKEIAQAHVDLNTQLGVNDINEKILADIADKREVDDYKVYCYKLIGHKVLERWEWPSKKMPMVFVDGDSYYSKGRQHTQSFVYHARDIQRFLNYCAVEIADALQKGRRETWTGTPEMIKGFTQQWKMPSNVQGILQYNTQRDGSRPQSIPPSEVPQSLSNTYQQLIVDLQQSMGTDPNLNRNNATSFNGAESGIAIANRIREGSVASYIFQDNLVRAMEEIGQIILSLIPKLYDTTRNVMLTKQDGEQTQEGINVPQEDNTVQNDMTKGEYHVIIEVGPSYELQKQEYLKILIGLVGTNPQIFPLVADLVADNIDIGNRQQLVERLKSLVPQPIQDKEAGRVPAPPPPPPPDPQLLIEQQKTQEADKERAFKERALQIEDAAKNRQLHFDAIKLAADMEAQQGKSAIDAGKIHAEIHKSNMNYQADLNKLIASTEKAL
jgi:hypothetical protein